MLGFVFCLSGTDSGHCLRRGVAIAVTSGLIFGLLVPTTGRSQEPSGLEAAVALQDVMVSAIERAGKSVVAIARVRKGERNAGAPDDPRSPLQFDAMPFGFLPDSNPTSPDFVPNEFASGVVLDREGYIVTNYHVLGNPEQNDYFVWVQRRPFKVDRVDVPQEVKAGDPWTDLAVLKIAASDLEPMPLGDASKLRKGMIVIALGNPYGIARDGEVSASWGIVSNLRRATAPDPQTADLGTERSTLDQYGTLIQTDARLDLGTSGGALVNLRGEMIGLTTSLAAMAGYEQPAGFAIPVDETFRKTVATLRQGRVPAFGFLGVQPDHLPLADRQAGRFGASVLRVVPGTPGEKAGLRPDDVITHVNQERVFDKNSLFRELSQRSADETVSLTFERRETSRQQPKTLTTTAVLSKKYVASSRAPFAQVKDLPWRGILVEYPSALPPQLSTQGLQAVDPEGCVAVAQVDRDSPAWKAGLRRGEYISHVGTRRVSTPQQFYAAVAEQQGAVQLKMTAGRDEAALRTVSAE
ncbi:MAG: trypsin-like peptidase domain-containing protein [Pirellulaceae bacterium]